MSSYNETPALTLEGITAAGALAPLKLGVGEICVAVADWVFESACRTDSDGDTFGVVEVEAKAT